MLSADLRNRLEALSHYVVSFYRQGKTRRQFWDGFYALEGDLGNRAFAEDAEPELREQYCEILADADDAGYAGPDEQLDEVMGD